MQSSWQPLLWLLPAISTAAVAHAERTTFQTPKLGTNLGVWRLTSDPTVRHHANYHNTQCWSPDGRYICYTCYGASGSEATSTVHVYDVHTDATREIGRGDSPRWAKRSNWLFYVDYSRTQRRQRTSDIVWLDMADGKRTIIAPGPGPEMLGETDFQDRWLYGALRFRGQNPEFQVIRIKIAVAGGYTKLAEVHGSQLLPNPRHPVFFTRQDHRSDPFAATRWWFDLDGSNKRIGVPTLQQCHMSWLGNGEYLLLGNGLIRGRRWNEPFPSGIHILAAVGVGDVSPCGTSGRYVCGDHSVADLRSGDGFAYIDPLSIICYPKSVGDDSGIYDADPKGSADGTKICFVSNYDLQHGPVTPITEALGKNSDRLGVDSTAGFPASGAICVQREVIGYRSTTPSSFEGLTRGLHDTLRASPVPSRMVTSFDARCFSPAQWERMGAVSTHMRKSIGDAKSPLLRQRQTDVYVAIVRRPDRPWLRRVGDALELAPGENHAETRGYRLLKNGQRLPGQPVRPGARVPLTEPGTYQAVAVEWSGLESAPSNALSADRQMTLQVRQEPPPDFTWSSQRWADAAHTVQETVHLYDGVIRREFFSAGRLTGAHDLNAKGKAIRRMTYRDGKLAEREYHTAAGVRVSREILTPEGSVAETIRYAHDGATEADHWWFERGMPVKLVQGARTYVTSGARFGRLDGDRFVDLPRGPHSE